MSSVSPLPVSDITLDQLLAEYQDIALMLNNLWPIESKNERVFSRTLKLTEEMGELSSEILTKMGLQRQAKVDAFEQHHLEDEMADVIASAILLAIELDIDIKAIMVKKLAFTTERLQRELENGAEV